MPLAAGGGASGTTEKKDDKSNDDVIADSVGKTQKIIQSDTIWKIYE